MNTRRRRILEQAQADAAAGKTLTARQRRAVRKAYGQRTGSEWRVAGYQERSASRSLRRAGQVDIRHRYCPSARTAQHRAS